MVAGSWIIESVDRQGVSHLSGKSIESYVFVDIAPVRVRNYSAFFAFMDRIKMVTVL